MPDVQAGASAAKPAELREQGQGWLRLGLLAAALVAILAVLYAPVFRIWFEDLWGDPNYTHSFFVPLISAFVIWRRRRELADLAPEGDWRGLLVILAGVVALILGNVGGETFLMRTSLLVILAGLVLLHLGPAFLRALAFPLAFLIFLVPMPHIFFYPMTARLQTVAAETGAAVLDLLGVPILLDGNVIHLNRMTFGVTEACSGIRSLLSLLFLGVAWAYLMLPRLWMRIVLVATVLPITIAANAGRIVLTALIGRWLGFSYAEGFYHFFSSWMIFGFAILCLLAVHGAMRLVAGRGYAEDDGDEAVRRTLRARAGGSGGTPRRQAVWAWVSVTVLVGALLILSLRSTGEAVPLRKPLDTFPTVVAEWQGRGGALFTAKLLNNLKVTDYLMRDYRDPSGRGLNLYIGYWDTQREGAAPHSPKNCLPGAGWEPLEASSLTIPLPPPHGPITVNRYLIQKDREQQLVLYWYQSQGEAIAGEVPARIAMVRNILVRNRTDGALIRIMSPVYGSVQETSDRLAAYVQALYPILVTYLPD